VLDEPAPAQLPELARRARLARAAGIRVFTTTVPQRPLDGLVDEYAPNLALVGDDKPAPHVRWSYASCMSHGCDELPASGRGRASMLMVFAGWPGYAIDLPGTAAAAVPLLGFRRGLEGELYYDMLHAWTGDPWTDVRAFAGNGDGTLLYPGRPRELGGTHPFPVESIRLKLIRDALEDVELFRLARAAGEGALADRWLARLVPSARVGHIGLYRDHDTLEPVDYYFKVPGDASERDFFLLDPMLATGGSAAAAVTSLKRAGATRIRFLCLVAAPEGVQRLADAHPDVIVYCASLDRELNAQGYILPGLGDAGDRLFGTR
jgi:uracil phosphoribosyltransferase